MTHPVAWTADEFEAHLRAKQAGYHIHHPFNLRMRAGECTPEEIRTWVANRFYYQVNIPLKDAAILSNCPDRETRREWIVRIHDHDGNEAQPGGIESWVRLGEAVGLTRDALWSHRHLLPGVRFAVDAYVNFARRAPWQEAVCSSLTEMFAPDIHKERLGGRLARALPVGAAGRAGVFPLAHSVGLARCRARTARDARVFLHAGTAAACTGHPAVQARHPLVNARCHSTGPCP